MLYYVKNQLSGVNQISYIFKAYFELNDKRILVSKEYSEEVGNWFREYTYLIRDKYNLKNFKVTSMNHHYTFKVSFDSPSTYSLFEIGEIITLLLDPDTDYEFPIIVGGIPYYVVGEIPEF